MVHPKTFAKIKTYTMTARVIGAQDPILIALPTNRKKRPQSNPMMSAPDLGLMVMVNATVVVHGAIQTAIVQIMATAPLTKIISKRRTSPKWNPKTTPMVVQAMIYVQH